MRRLRALVAGVVLVAVAAAVFTLSRGGPTREQYVAAAERICTTALEDIDALAQPEDARQLVASFRASIDLAQRAADDLAALDEPEPDRFQDALVRPLQEQVAAARGTLPAFERALTADDPDRAVEAVPEPPLPTVDTAALVAAGLTSCAELWRASRGVVPGGGPADDEQVHAGRRRRRRRPP